MNQSDFAKLHNVSRKTVTAWKARGWLVLAGDDIDVEASNANIERFRKTVTRPEKKVAGNTQGNKAGNKTGTGSITAVLPSVLDDTTGGGVAGNADAGTSLTVDVAIDGVLSVATATVKISGGADIESEDAFRSRMLLAYQNTPQGGNDTDYRGWALSVPGITRCWVKRRLQGVGTVGIYIMCDGNDSGGFPVGTDGVSQLEEWGAVKATGDQGRVADHVYPLQPIIAIIYVCAPVAAPVNFVISGIPAASSETTLAINTAIDEVFFTEGEPGGKILLSSLLLAIGDVAGTRGFILDSPTTNIQLETGQLPVRGTVTYR